MFNAFDGRLDLLLAQDLSERVTFRAREESDLKLHALS